MEEKRREEKIIKKKKKNQKRQVAHSLLHSLPIYAKLGGIV